MRQRDWLIVGAALGGLYVLSRRGLPVAPAPQRGPDLPSGYTRPAAPNVWEQLAAQLVGRAIAQPVPTSTAYDPTLGLPITPAAPEGFDYAGYGFIPEVRAE